MASFNNEIQQRANSRAEIGAPHLTDDQIIQLNRYSESLIEDLGIPLGSDPENWTIPISGYTPRLFIMGLDEDGNDGIKALSGMNIKPGSPEFWRQVQLGNVYAYPEGQKDPVQLQVSVKADASVELNYSKPVNASNVSPAPSRSVPFWKRALNFITAGRAYRKEVNAFRNRESDQARIKTKLQDMQENRIQSTKNVDEKALADKARAELEAKKKEEQRQVELEGTEKARNAEKIGIRHMVSVFRPDPEMIRDPKEGMLRSPENNNYALYTEKQFNDLKVYSKKDIDLETIKIGDSAVSLEDFAAVTMFALWDDDLCIAAAKITASTDKYAIECLEKVGIPSNDGKRMLAAMSRSMHTGDLFIVPPRDNEGSYFKEFTNAGRKKAVDAFNAYKSGDKTELAKIIADGINKTAEYTCGLEFAKISAQDQAALTMSEYLLGLMEKDPELKQLAIENGMEEEKLETVEGVKVLNGLKREADEARYKIEKSTLEGEKLSEKDLKDCVSAINKYETAVSQIAIENTKDNETILEIQTNILMNAQGVNKLDEQKWQKDPDSRPAPKPGKIWSDTAATASEGLKTIYRPLPQALKSLTSEKGLNDLEKLSNEIVKQQYADKDQDWVYEEMRHGQNKKQVDMTKAIPDAQKELLNPKQKQVIEKMEEGPKVEDNNVVKKPSVKDLAKMFEPKGPQNNGPQIGP